LGKSEEPAASHEEGGLTAKKAEGSAAIEGEAKLRPLFLSKNRYF
jgi:hypothetical protein